jgi:hypothetical protein
MNEITEEAFVSMFPENATTVVLRCGRNGCGDRVGLVKTDGTMTRLLRFQKIGEVPVPAPRLTAPTEEELKLLIAEREANMTAGRDAKLLRRTDDGYVVPRRREWPAVSGPLEELSFVMCPTHGKLDVPTDIASDLEQFVADTRAGSTRLYSIFRGSSL